MKWSMEAPSVNQMCILRRSRRTFVTLLLCGLLGISCLITGGCGGVKVQAKQREKAASEFEQARKLVHHGKFDNAIQQLDAFSDKHPNHKLSSRVLFLRAKSQMGLQETEAAQAGFAQVIEKFPGSEEARKAEYKLAMMEYLNGNNAEAKTRFQEIAKAANGPYTPEAVVWLEFVR